MDAYPGGVSCYGVWDMGGNMQEWTMTAEWSPYIEYESFVRKAWAVKFDSEMPGVDHLLFNRGLGKGRGDAFYTGFRPVMDVWWRQHWSGFKAEDAPQEEKKEKQKQHRKKRPASTTD